jgi:hypothetical protein
VGLTCQKSCGKAQLSMIAEGGDSERVQLAAAALMEGNSVERTSPLRRDSSINTGGYGTAP